MLNDALRALILALLPVAGNGFRPTTGGADVYLYGNDVTPSGGMDTVTLGPITTNGLVAQSADDVVVAGIDPANGDFVLQFTGLVPFVTSGGNPLPVTAFGWGVGLGATVLAVRFDEPVVFTTVGQILEIDAEYRIPANNIR